MGTTTISGLGEVERRQLVTSAARSVLSTGALLTLYYLIPIQLGREGVGYTSIGTLLRLGVAVAAFAAVLVVEIRAITKSNDPILRAGVAMAVVIPLFIIFFAWTYLSMSVAEPAAFNEHLDRTKALYFTVTIFSTVGFGDIVPKSDHCRIVTMVQMMSDLLLIAVVVRVIFGAAKETKKSAALTSSADEPPSL